MIFRIWLIGILFVIPVFSFAQLQYSNSEASFLVYGRADKYYVECTLKRDVAGSRHLKRLQNRLRLRAVDLVGNYIVFNNLDFKYRDKEKLFYAFVDYSNLMFRAQVEKFSQGQWDFCGGARCITFRCNRADFIIEDKRIPENFDFAEILMFDFRRNKTVEGACHMFSAGISGPFETLDLELMFLKGKVPTDENIRELQQLHPGSRLENSLFGNDSTMQSLIVADTIAGSIGCPFSRMIKSKILFTGAPISLKDSIYQVYLVHLAACENTWYRAQLFCAENRDISDFFGLSEASVFDVIGAYPLAFDIFGLRLGFGGQYYDKALAAFAHEDISKALDLLRDEINYSGITPEALNLTGACYRVLDRPEKALPYLLLAFYLNRETTYLAGNTCLCLDAMNYSDLDRLATYFLESPKTDSWSKTQISNILNQ